MKHESVTVSLDELRKRIRAAGMRCTTARLTVLGHLMKMRRPLSHSEVADQLAAQGFDRATIYRNLVELAEAKLIARVELGDHVWRFEAERAEHQQQEGRDHAHFVCVDCGEVSCLPSNAVNISPHPGTKHSDIGLVTDILIRGRCEECS